MSFLGGFADAFSSSLQQAKDNKDRTAVRKAETKLFELQLKAGEAASAKARGQADFYAGGTNNILSAFPEVLNTATTQAFALGEPVDKRDARPEMMVRLGNSPDQTQTQTQTQGPHQQGDGLLNFLAGVSLNEIAKVFDVDTALKVQESRQKQRTFEDKTKTDVNGRLRWTTGNKKGELVFPGVEKDFAAQSTTGQDFADMLAIQEQYGADSPQARAFVEMLEQGSAPSLSDTTAVRKEFTINSKNNTQSFGAFKQLAHLATDSTGAGDVMLIFRLMQFLDPGTAVRGSEVTLASGIGGPAGKFLNIYNRLFKGEILTPPARYDILYQASHLARDMVADQRRLEQQYTGIANDAGAEPSNIVLDWIGDVEKSILPENAKKPVKPIAQVADEVQDKGLVATITGAYKTYFEDGTDEDEAESPYTGWTNEQLREELGLGD